MWWISFGHVRDLDDSKRIKCDFEDRTAFGTPKRCMPIYIFKDVYGGILQIILM